MKWYSTRDAERKYPFTLKEAALMGLAPDGGLFMPETIPQVDMEEVVRRAEISFPCMASYLAELFFGDDFKTSTSRAVNSSKVRDSDYAAGENSVSEAEGSTSSALLEEVCNKAFDFEIPLVEIAPGLRTLELFHGPTFAFKDVGARFMGRMFGELMRSEGSCVEQDGVSDGGNLGGTVGRTVEGENGKQGIWKQCGTNNRVVVLTATSGDTGSAVAGGFYGVDGVEVVILFPEGKVSAFQRAQMTTLGGNIHAVEVNGTFDDCQRMVKECFCDSSLRAKVNITSANSINILRWIPQSFYYFYAWCKGCSASVGVALGGNAPVGVALGGNAPVGGASGGGDPAACGCVSNGGGCGGYAPVVVVPSGNFGNIAAGILAQKMGLPVRKFVCASNANDIVPKFLESGVYSPKASVHTVANAMDVGNPSNFERLEALYGSREAIRSELVGFSFSDAQICDAIGRIHSRYGYFSDPHSATGFLAWERVKAEISSEIVPEKGRKIGSEVGFKAGCEIGSEVGPEAGRDTGSESACNLVGFWISTAHPAKFGDIVDSSTGVKMTLPEKFKEILGRRGESLKMAADVKTLGDYLLQV